MANQTDNYTSKYKVDISDLKKGIAEANKTIKTANAEFKNATAGTNDWSKSADGLSAKIKQQQTIIDAEKKKLELLKEQLSRLNQNQESGKTIIAELTVKHQEAVKTYGESSEQAKKYAKQLTDAQAAQERNANAADELRLKIINQDTAVKNAESQVSRYQSALSDLQNHTETLTEKVQRQQSELDKLKQKYANVAAEQGKNSTEAKELAGKISDLSGELKDNRNRLNEAEQAADTLDDSLEDVGDSADKTTSGGLTAFSVALGNLATKVITGVIDKLKEMAVQTVNAGTSFDTAMSTVAGTFGYTVDQLSDETSEMSENVHYLRDYAKEIGEATKFSATQAADGMNYAAMAGWKTQEILDGYGGIVYLAAAANEELATTSDILTDALSAMKQPASEASHFADVMAATASNANTNVALMGETFKEAATVAGAMGASIEDLALATGLMANSGIKGSSAGTTLKASLVNLVKPTKQQAEAMKRLGLITTETINVVDDDKVEKAQQKVIKETADLEKAQIAYNKALEKYSSDSAQVQSASGNVEKAQIKLNDAIAKYGAESTQAQTASVNLTTAQAKLNEVMSQTGENSPEIQTALVKLQTAEQDLTNAQNALTKAQQGTIQTVETGHTAFTDEYGNMKSLKEIMDVLRSSLKAVNVELVDNEGNIREYDDIISELEQSEEGLTQAEQLKDAAIIFGKQNLAGMMAIVNASEEDYNKLADAIYNSKDAAQNMSETMIDNLGGDLTILKSKLEAVEIAIYEKFEPSLRKAAAWVGTALDKALTKVNEAAPVIEKGINWLIDHGSELISTLAGIAAGFVAFKAVTSIFAMVAAVQKAITAFQAFLTTIQAVKAGQMALNATMLANPVGLIVAAITALVVGFITLWNTSEEFRNFWIGLWESIQETLFKFFDNWISGWTSIKEFFLKVWNDFQEIFQIGMDAVVGFFASAWENIKNGWNGVSAFFTGIGESIRKTVWKALDAVIGFFTAASQKAESVWNGITTFFSSLWTGIQTIFSTVAEWINNNVFEPIKAFFQPVIMFFAEAWKIIGELAQGCINLIFAVWTLAGEWFNTNVTQPIKNFFIALWTAVKDFALTAWENIKNGWKIAGTWFNTNVIQPIKNFFIALWTAVKDFALTAWENIKNGWKIAGTWFNTNVIQPIKNFFIALWTAVKDFALTAWENIKNGWKIVGTWFNDNVIQPVNDFFTGMWDGVKNGAVQAWDGITQTFAHVADWFGDKFSAAWQRVKDVFSTGGKVFDGIKDGIFSAFKSVVNTLIRGINTIIAVPFNAINNALDTIAGIQILDFQPFAGLISRFSVPEIPQLAKGGIVKKPTIAQIGEAGTEAVIPLERNKAGLKKLADLLKDDIFPKFPKNGSPAGAGGATVVKNYNFNQTNTSPKALSRSEIYRQTKNLIRTLKREDLT